ncbi:hypothetical protein MA852_08535 [Campylobacter coli]|nr:hypothetical protein [Campylobacter coli]UKW11520.1 hypothetical protein MA852_08535 [Campylobacter coli]BEJ72372.1 hypothetical protein B10328_16090 [Campylobacter coli]
MLDRRRFLKIGAALSTLPLIPTLGAGKSVEATKVSLGLVKNGEVITAAQMVKSLKVNLGKKSLRWIILCSITPQIWFINLA